MTVDQCGECRGIFLDRGELDRLVDAEAAWAGRQSGQPRYDEPRYDEPQYDQPRYEGGYQQQYRKPRKRKSFFDELFD